MVPSFSLSLMISKSAVYSSSVLALSSRQPSPLSVVRRPGTGPAASPWESLESKGRGGSITVSAGSSDTALVSALQVLALQAPSRAPGPCAPGLGRRLHHRVGGVLLHGLQVLGLGPRLQAPSRAPSPRAPSPRPRPAPLVTFFLQQTGSMR